MSEPIELPKSVKKLNVNGKQIVLVGTAHVSRESVQDVRTVIQAVQPESVCVELCESRYHAIAQRDNWKKLNIFRVIREKKSLMLLIQLIMSSFYRRLGEQLGVQPGAEMIEGIDQAKAIDADLVLADRDIQITLKRVWGYLNVWSKFKMAAQLLASLFVSETIDEEMIEQMKQQDQLEALLDTFSESLPGVKERLIDERDIFLAQNIRSAPGDTVVAIVGAGHVSGIVNHIRQDHSLTELNEVPPKSYVPTVFKWGIPMIIVALIILGFMKGGSEHTYQSLVIWVGVNGVLSAVGAALAFGHPLTILSAFLAAPLTSLNPMVAAGVVAGLVQAWVKKPTVEDLETLPTAVTTVKGFWRNPMSRILLVVVLANLGSSFGTFISGGWIAARLF